MGYSKFRCLMAVTLSLASFVSYCGAQATEQVAELLAKEQRLPGRSNAAGLDPAFKEINAEKILPLSIEEVQANFRKYLEEYRTYFGK